MISQKLYPWQQKQLYSLLQVAKGKQECDLYIKNGTIINVYTGELVAANIAILGQHIAYVGDLDSMVGSQTQVMDATGMYLCPGYIEPHAHPFQTYHPVTLAQKVMTWGTTTLVCDNLLLYMHTDGNDLLDLWAKLARLPVKLLWSVRLDSQTNAKERLDKFAPDKIAKILHTPWARQVGELTDWPSLLDGDEYMLANMITAQKLGKKVEGHLPGASPHTLNILAAGGVTACHESITGQEALERLRLGMYVTLRHSSLRPDLPVLLKDLLAGGVDLRRAMLTTDGVTLPSLKHGFTDYLIKLALEAGVPMIDAYRMVTLNPAVYYGLDQEIGGLAPGRLADIVFLEDPLQPTPVQVFANGQLVFQKGVTTLQLPDVDWDQYNVKPLAAYPGSLQPEWMLPPHQGGSYPVLDLVNPVITRKKDCVLPVYNNYINLESKPGLVYAALLDRQGSWVTNGVISGLAEQLEGLACSNTVTGDILALGRSPQAMVQAAQRVFDLGGGVVLVEDNQIIYELPLTLGGMMSTDSIEHLIPQATQLYHLMAQRGHRHYDFLYTLLFLSATHLPEIRLSPDGLFAVKERSVLIPCRRI